MESEINFELEDFKFIEYLPEAKGEDEYTGGNYQSKYDDSTSSYLREIGKCKLLGLPPNNRTPLVENCSL